jgi:hypothetical protein
MTSSKLTQAVKKESLHRHGTIFLQAPMTHASSIAADAFAAALAGIQVEDWDRTVGQRTGQMMLRMTSKRVKEAVSKASPTSCCEGEQDLQRRRARNGTVAERLQHILVQLEKLSSQCRITRLDLSRCCISDQDEDKLAGVLLQKSLCPGFFTFDLIRNQIRVTDTVFFGSSRQLLLGLQLKEN